MARGDKEKSENTARVVMAQAQEGVRRRGVASESERTMTNAVLFIWLDRAIAFLVGMMSGVVLVMVLKGLEIVG